MLFQPFENQRALMAAAIAFRSRANRQRGAVNDDIRHLPALASHAWQGTPWLARKRPPTQPEGHDGSLPSRAEEFLDLSPASGRDENLTGCVVAAPTQATLAKANAWRATFKRRGRRLSLDRASRSRAALSDCLPRPTGQADDTRRNGCVMVRVFCTPSRDVKWRRIIVGDGRCCALPTP
jgi:hypothetical protein